jgi:N-acetylmuramic acid 6-phosphate etherase
MADRPTGTTRDLKLQSRSRRKAKQPQVRITMRSESTSRRPKALRAGSESALSGVHSTRLSPTEQRNPRSMKLDRLSVAKGVRLMLTEDAKVPRALLRQQKQLARAVQAVAHAFRAGGRLFYVGAGSSGRLGVLDASECPVTFRSPPEMVQGIIAGGRAALWRAVEGAEDDWSAGARAIIQRRAGTRDVVLGIAASGTTPFVWGALREARRRGATTVLLAFNPYLVISKAMRPDIVIVANLGPEVLTGSTRLKAGTATKLVLNILTTLAMVRIGKVISNLMVDVVPGNVKLRDRAVRIVQTLTGADYSTAEAALQKSRWNIKKSCAQLDRR